MVLNNPYPGESLRVHGEIRGLAARLEQASAAPLISHLIKHLPYRAWTQDDPLPREMKTLIETKSDATTQPTQTELQMSLERMMRERDLSAWKRGK